jgi:4-hydroxybenzoate polyprenyltransferase
MWFLYLIIGLISGYLGHRKGYSFLIWFLAGGVPGLLVLAFLPYANDPLKSPEENDRLVQSGNTTGIVVIAFALAIGCIFWRQILGVEE